MHWHITLTRETPGLAQEKESKSKKASDVYLSVKRNGKLFLQRREKYGRIQIQLAESLLKQMETQLLSQDRRCEINLRKSSLIKDPFDKTQTHKTGICLTRVTAALQNPVGVEKPSEVLRFTCPDAASGVRGGSLILSRSLAQEGSSHLYKYREAREMGISIFQEKMQKHSAFPVEIWQGSEHNKAKQPA